MAIRIPTDKMLAEETIKIHGLKVDQKWFVKLPGKSHLTEVVIKEMRSFVIMFDTGEYRNFGLDMPTLEWFELSAVKYIEQST